MEGDINLHLPENLKDVVIRTGDAPRILQPQKVEFTGHITSPANYFEQRLAEEKFDCTVSHVEIDKRNLSITLIEDETSEIANRISGKLSIDPDLLAFKISPITQVHDRSKSDFVRFLNLNKRFFSNKEEHKKLINGLAEFAYKREVNGESKDDLKGSFRELYEQKLKASINLSFTLVIPIFDGYEEKKFKVDIIPNITDGSVSFSMDSVEVAEIYHAELEKILGAEEKRFKKILILRK